VDELDDKLEDSDGSYEDIPEKAFVDIKYETPKREPSPLWDKNIDELVSIITSDGKPSMKKRENASKDKKKLSK
jgi:hypothetical protein